MNTSVLYFTIAVVCLWLVLSQFYGEQYITKFVLALMPSLEK